MSVAQPATIMCKPTIYANTGGPMSRTRKERIVSTLLGKDEGFIQCPRRIRLGLKFEGAHPVDCLEAILASEGFTDPEELRSRYIVPQGRLICRPMSDEEKRLSAIDGRHYDVLEQALMLGLCTAQIYDTKRPVLWTESSLTRVVELFDPVGFYA